MADETEEVLVETGGEETPEQPQEAEQTTDEAGDVEAEGQAETTEAEPEIKSERGQKRVQELANERNNLKQENQTLRQAVQEEPPAVSQQETPPWMQPGQEFENLAGQELTPEQYEAHLTARARQMAQLEVAQLRQEMTFKNNLEQDVSYLERTYPELSGEISDPSLQRAISKAQENFKKAQKADPNVRLRDFIEPMMDVRQGGEQQGRATATARLNEQASDSAPRSDKSSAARLSSEAQLEKALADGTISIQEAEKLMAELQG
jgi:hypothetical protein